MQTTDDKPEAGGGIKTLMENCGGKTKPFLLQREKWHLFFFFLKKHSILRGDILFLHWQEKEARTGQQ
jgi:hypothetical protein